ncbi:MAG: hypothetical protein JXB07_01875 [Anaerolineae bacterium]|nr:hypothetical protein [Anaerolineae bacterium]
MTKVRVTVPATTCNLGPGLDCLALALGLHNIIELVEIDYGLELDLHGDYHAEALKDTADLVLEAASSIFRKAGYLPGGLRVHMESHIPPGSSLGGDGAALLGGAIAANILLGSPYPREEILQQIIALENRPHALLAALSGGLVVSSHSDGNLIHAPIPVTPMTVIVAMPTADSGDFDIDLPQRVRLQDAIFNIGHTALTVQALSSGNFDLLSRAMQDRLYNEVHSKSIPGYDQMRQAALKSRAAAVSICGAGPALVVFAQDNHREIAKAMARAYRKTAQEELQTWVLPIDTQGISISEMGMTPFDKPIPASDHPVTFDHQQAHPPSPNSDATSHPTVAKHLAFVPGLEGQNP